MIVIVGRKPPKPETKAAKVGKAVGACALAMLTYFAVNLMVGTAVILMGMLLSGFMPGGMSQSVYNYWLNLGNAAGGDRRFHRLLRDLAQGCQASACSAHGRPFGRTDGGAGSGPCRRAERIPVVDRAIPVFSHLSGSVPDAVRYAALAGHPVLWNSGPFG